MFFLFLLLLPLIEIVLFVAVGDEIGVGNTILLCILSAIIGVAIVRKQGTDILLSINAATRQGEVPVQSLFDGMCIAVAGILLIIPGFFTDAIAIVLLTPPGRAVVRHVLAQRVQVYGQTGRPTNPYTHHTSRTDDVLDVEFEEVGETEAPNKQINGPNNRPE